MQQRIKDFLRKHLTRKNAASAARALLAFVGGAWLAYAIATGRVDAATAKLILAWLTQTTGFDIPGIVVTTIGPLVWAILFKNHREKVVIASALELPEGSTEADLEHHVRTKRAKKSAGGGAP